MKYIRIVIALAFLSALFTATTCDDSTVYRADVALVNNSKELLGGTIVLLPEHKGAFTLAQ